MPAPEPDTTEPTPLLGLRAALILLLAALTGIGAGVLAALAGRHPAEAVLIGVTALAAAAAFFNWAVARL
ncbi:MULTISPECIES: hypothetical protein [unclassified Crossiella]|uniref:hypothetical protein n=1 Tax=unclassified Crossiella TaxID=2620835 RepID=UPI001FFFDC31|nr:MULTISPECIES: hypothetical protein [unclassified Crossiella]MCK2237437.1 hypothetical protein [Crossiella sp. S99.2]MCK2251092.1 hypothetical protein [Crossiella sp. S99.1]